MPPRLYTVPEDRGRGPRGAPLRRLPPAGGKEPLARLRLQSAVVPARDCRIADHHGTSLPRLPGTLRPIQIVFSRTGNSVSGEPSAGSQDTVAGGGRYDGLSEDLDGPPTKGFGFGMGLERLILSIPNTARIIPDYTPEYFVAPLGDEAFNRATLLARKLRSAGKRVYLDFDARSLKSQMRLADKLQAKSVIIIGEEELKSGTLLVRNMSTKEQRTIREEEL